MKTTGFILCFLAALPCYSLDYGMCQAIPNSKQYLNNVFMDPYPRTVEFKCLYQCMSEDGVEDVWGRSQVTARNTSEDATKTVCQGVKVKRTSWGWDFDKTIPFYAHLANTEEVKTFATNEIQRDNPIEKKLLRELKESLGEVARTYIMVGSQPGVGYFKDAGIEMLEISDELPSNTDKLDELIHVIKTDPETYPSGTKEGILYGFIKSAAKFRF